MTYVTRTVLVRAIKLETTDNGSGGGAGGAPIGNILVEVPWPGTVSLKEAASAAE